MEFYFGVQSASTPVIFDHVVGVDALADGSILVGGGSVSYKPTSGGASPKVSKAVFGSALIQSDGILDREYGDEGIARVTYASQNVDTLGYQDSLKSGQQPVKRVLLELTPTAFAVGPTGTAFLAASSGQLGIATAASCNAQGKVVFVEDLPPNGLSDVQSTDATIYGAAALADGRFAVLGDGYPIVLTPISADGSVGQAQDGFESGSAITVDSAGDLLVAGVDFDGNPGAYYIQAYASGSASAQPNYFAAAAISNALYDVNAGIVLTYYDSADGLTKTAALDRYGQWTSPTALPDAGEEFSAGPGYSDDAFPPNFAFSGPGNKGVYLDSHHAKELIAGGQDTIGQVALQDDESDAGVDTTEVVYLDQTTRKLEFASDGDGWVPQAIAAGKIDDVQFVVDQNNQNQVAYVDDDVVYLASQHPDGSWGHRIIASTVDGAEGVSLAQDGSGALVFYDEASGKLKIANVHSDGTIVVKTLASGVGEYTSMPDINDLYAYDAATDTVQHYWDPFGPATLSQDDFPRHPTVSTVVTDGGADVEVPYNGVQDGPNYDIVYVDSSTGDLVVDGLNQEGN